MTAWAKAAAIRAIRTAAQAAVAIIGSGAVFDAVNWTLVGSGAGMAAVLSVLMSLAGLPEAPTAPLERAGP